MEAPKLQSSSSTLIFFVNGKKVIEDRPNPRWTLLDYLRDKIGLRGSKLGCGEGGCGACTVMLSRYNRSDSSISHWSVTACLTPVCAVHGLAVTTVEGIGKRSTSVGALHPVQERLAANHGSQCGYCTPGFVMSMYSLLRNKAKPTLSDIETCIQGNLCRCTGYRPILESFYSFSDQWKQDEDRALQCCGQNSKQCCQSQTASALPFSATPPYDPTQEPIFPPELMVMSKLDQEELVFWADGVTWYRPANLQNLLYYKTVYPDAKILTGNTEIGIEVKFKGCCYDRMVYIRTVPELLTLRICEDGLEVGSAVTLSEFQSYLVKITENYSEEQVRYYHGFLKMLHWFAGPAIRNMGTIGGNIMTGSPISDLVPLLMATGATLKLARHGSSERTVPLDDSFFVSYRKNTAAREEVLLSIFIPLSTKFEFFRTYKQSRRREDDIAIVNAAMRVEFLPGTDIVKSLVLVFGGMGPTAKMARQTAARCIDKKWDGHLLSEVQANLLAELQLPPDAPGGMTAYRRTLVASFFLKFFSYVHGELVRNGSTTGAEQHEYLDREDDREVCHVTSSQLYSVVTEKRASCDPIGRPLVHHSAFQQASGEAVYTDDIPNYVGELYLCPVLSTRAHANILGIDCGAALAIQGVRAVFTAADLTLDQNCIGHIEFDEEIFASKKVTCVGQIIAAVVADSRECAQKASRLIKVMYEDLEPVLTIQEAIAANSFYEAHTKILECGDVFTSMEQADVVIAGEMTIGGQEHFYLETQAAIAVPRGEHEEIEVWSATQDPAGTQKLIAKALSIAANRVVVRVKRIGGGFGGKETRSTCVALPVAIAAARLQKPVRCTLDRDEDMLMTGGRHPYLVRYRVGATKTGIVKALQMEFLANAGCTVDLSPAIVRTSLFHATNAYTIPNCSLKGYCCKTNLPSNTAFRCFGRPQAILAAETWMGHLAQVLDMSPVKIREINLQRHGDSTPCGQRLDDCTIRSCWTQLLDICQYEDRLNELVRFNRYRKKGIAVTPAIFGVAFGPLFMNQASASVFIYTDGSVLIHHCGMEMGQGLHIKIIQIASRALQIPPERIHIQETATDKLPNGSATAASSGSDLNGAAVLDACKQLSERLEPYRRAKPQAGWDCWIHDAYMDRVPLLATGFYKVPDIHLDMSTNRGRPYNYFTYGAACSEVVIDCLTGDHEVLRTDIVMDVGESLNPAIDIGQIEGAFVQGYGLFTLEELQYDAKGCLLTKGPGNYKIPAAGDVPKVFNVALLRGSSNPRAIYSSKAVGEPPLALAASVFCAIKEAVGAARKDNGLDGYFALDSPATAERIRMACQDAITRLESEASGGAAH